MSQFMFVFNEIIEKEDEKCLVFKSKGKLPCLSRSDLATSTPSRLTTSISVQLSSNSTDCHSSLLSRSIYLQICVYHQLSTYLTNVDKLHAYPTMLVEVVIHKKFLNSHSTHPQSGMVSVMENTTNHLILTLN